MSVGHVADRSIAAAGWMSAGTFLRAILQVAAQVTFARVLGPDHFGVFLLASLAVSLSALFADIGMSYALIQKKEITACDIRLSFTWHVMVASVVATLLATLAPYLADWFNDPRVGPVLAVLATTLLINAAGIPAMNLLRRDLNFKAIQLALISSYFVGYIVVGIPALMLGAGIWAPVLAWLTQAGINTTLLYIQKPHAIRPLLLIDDNYEFLRYSATFLATNLTNWTLMNIDRVLLGRLAGTTEVGLYATPYNLLNNPTLQILNTTQSILFAASSRLQENLPDMRRAYLAVLAAVALLVAPVFAGISAAAPTLIEVIYGPVWAPAAEVMRALALAMPIYLVWALSTPILWNTGQKTREYRLQMPLIPVWGVAVWFAAQTSIVVLAYALIFMQCVRAFSTTYPAAKALGLRLRDYANVLGDGIFISLAVALVVWGADFALHELALPVFMIMILDVVAAAVTWLVLLRMMGRRVHPEFNRLVLHTTSKLPAWVSRILTTTLFPQLPR